MDQAPSSCAILPQGTKAGSPSELQLAERLRVQELLRYFLPHHNSPPAGESKPRASTDPSLTAFAQLCALKTNCQRSFISLIDDKQQYILAEATRTTWLDSGEYTGGVDNALSFGQASLDLFSGVCPSTIACFTSPNDSLHVFSEYVKASRSYYVMNDMSQLEHYKDRPYILGWPYMRYYAEVPLTSPSGYVIGSLCVVDNKARDGLDSQGIRILEEVASTIMDHLELCSIRVQRNRAERMIQALGQFSEGNNSVREWWMKAQISQNPEPAFRHLTLEERADVELGSRSGYGPLDLPNKSRDPSLEDHQFYLSKDTQEAENKPFSSQDSESNLSSFRNDLSDTNPLISAPESHSTVDSKSVPLASPSNPSISTTSLSNPPQDSPKIRGGPGFQSSNKNKDMLSRAANLMREGIGSSGVVLLDPRSIDGNLMPKNESVGEKIVSPKTFPIFPGYHAGSMPAGYGRSNPFARVISCSTQSGNASDMIEIPVRILAILLAQFPGGGVCEILNTVANVISFDNRGIVKATKLTSAWDKQIPSTDERKIYPFLDQEDGPDINEIDMRAICEITNALPGVTSLISFPLWDASRNKWFSYGLAWTTHPTRVFARQDFVYLSTFVNSITVELSRIEVMAANQAKSSFVSSISHELRSPLHGIMATLEVLRDLTTDPIYEDELTTLEHCGSTLLDTIDNVLSFTKTNMSTSKNTGEVAIGKSARVVNLGLLVEEVVSISLSGNHFREMEDLSMHKNGEPPINADQVPWLSTPVTVICDITPGHDWLFETDRACWKRVLLNLVGNSLKYTSSGFIVVKLEREDSQPKSPLFQDLSASNSEYALDPTSLDSFRTQNGLTEQKIILFVKDSGKGMSQDYLNNYLFKPFYQEDSMAPGTGLGLSIVSQLVSSLGGEINVVSELGQGTEITITATLQLPRKVIDSVQPSITPAKYSGLKLGLLGLDAVPDVDDTSGIQPTSSKCNIALRAAIVNSATSIGLSVITVKSVEFSVADILVIPENLYCQQSRLQIESLRKPVLVLSSQSAKVRQRKRTSHPNVVFLFEPFGPTRFHQALKSCLVVRKRLENHQASGQTDPPAHPKTLTTSPVGPTNSAANASLQNVQAPPKILLVEDNPVNLKLLVMCMKQMDQSFLTAVDGSLAVDTYRKYSSTIELILMDVQMPIMDGIEASRQIRRIEKSTGSSPAFIAALTALSSFEAKEAALENGVNFFLTKPVSLKRLKELVKQHCSPTAIT